MGCCVWPDRLAGLELCGTLERSTLSPRNCVDELEEGAAAERDGPDAPWGTLPACCEPGQRALQHPRDVLKEKVVPAWRACCGVRELDDATDEGCGCAMG